MSDLSQELAMVQTIRQDLADDLRKADRRHFEQMLANLKGYVHEYGEREMRDNLEVAIDERRREIEFDSTDDYYHNARG